MSEPVTGSGIIRKIRFLSSALVPGATTSAMPSSTNDQESLDHNPNHEIHDQGKREKMPKRMNYELLGQVGKKRRMSFFKSDHVGSSSRGPKLASLRHDINEVRPCAIIRSGKVQLSLRPELPSFSKFIASSHINKGLMAIPRHFSRKYLPENDTTVVLVDEREKEYQVKYSGETKRLSAGWKKFSAEQGLMENDTIVFQLIKPLKFKVYIVRASNKGDSALSLVTSALHNFKKNDKGEDYENFRVLVDGMSINSELTEYTRGRYFDLCSVEKDFLHAGLLQSLNLKLIVGIICQTVDIAETVRNCSILTCEKQFVYWERTLESFMLLGMKVDFLYARVRRLLELGFESDEALELRKYGCFRAEDDMDDMDLQEASGMCDEYAKALKLKAENLKLRFLEEVHARW